MRRASVVGSQSSANSSGAEQAHLARAGGEDAAFDDAGDAGVFGFGQGFGDAVFALVEALLLEPRQGPAAVGVKVAFLLGEHFVEHLVDER